MKKDSSKKETHESESKKEQPNILTNSKNDPIVTSQSKIWDLINAIELPIVQFFQYILCIKKAPLFWEYLAQLAASKVPELGPFFFLTLGRPQMAYDLAKAVVLYSIFSSFGKFFFIRRRPCSYQDKIYCYSPAATSGFPSRHTLSVTIISSFTQFRNILIPLLILDRIMCGLHFPTDCIAAVFLGKIALYAAKIINDQNLLIILSIIGFYFWNSGAKIISGSLPILISKPIRFSPIFLPLVLVKRPIQFSLNKLLPKGSSSLIVSGLFTQCLLLLIMSICNDYLLKLKDANVISEKLWTFLDPVIDRLFKDPLNFN